MDESPSTNINSLHQNKAETDNTSTELTHKPIHSSKASHFSSLHTRSPSKPPRERENDGLFRTQNGIVRGRTCAYKFRGHKRDYREAALRRALENFSRTPKTENKTQENKKREASPSHQMQNSAANESTTLPHISIPSLQPLEGNARSSLLYQSISNDNNSDDNNEDENKPSLGTDQETNTPFHTTSYQIRVVNGHPLFFPPSDTNTPSTDSTPQSSGHSHSSSTLASGAHSSSASTQHSHSSSYSSSPSGGASSASLFRPFRLFPLSHTSSPPSPLSQHHRLGPIFPPLTHTHEHTLPEHTQDNTAHDADTHNEESHSGKREQNENNEQREHQRQAEEQMNNEHAESKAPDITTGDNNGANIQEEEEKLNTLPT